MFVASDRKWNGNADLSIPIYASFVLMARAMVRGIDMYDLGVLCPACMPKTPSDRILNIK